MAFGSNILVSTGSWGTTFQVPSAGFSNPQYLGPPDPAGSGVSLSTGFGVEPAAVLFIAFEGTYSGATVVHEQCLDEQGLTGWFPVAGYAVDLSSSGTGVCSTGVCYAFPVNGVRHRVRVTALASGTMVARVSIDSDPSVNLGAFVGGSGGGSVPVIVGNRTPLGYQQIVGLAAATALTVPNGSKIALITCETQNVRWRDDGTNPTASVGYPLLIGQNLLYDGTLSAIKFIEQTASATLDVAYYG